MKRRGLIVDFGGVLTTPVRDSYIAFCEAEGLEVASLRRVIRSAYRDASPDDPIVQFELGYLEKDDFERRLAEVLSRGIGRDLEPGGLAARIMGSTSPDERMIAAVRVCRGAGVKTGLLSNSWGNTEYPAELLELFDTVVISAKVHLRKPDAAIFQLCLRNLGLVGTDCVFVDDARPNCEAAASMGMHAILHRDADTTIPELERELAVRIS